MGTCIIFLQAVCTAAPIVQKIVNDTDFGFVILKHDDSSECTLQNKCLIIQPRSTFNRDFLLELGAKGLVLRPIFYKDQKQNKIFWITDQKSYDYDDALIQEAYDHWIVGRPKRKYKHNPQFWFKHWVGGDVTVSFDPVEILAYLSDQPRARITNVNSNHAQWLKFAKGIFSKLMLELHLSQISTKGIFSKLFVEHGQGGICNSGVVERI